MVMNCFFALECVISILVKRLCVRGGVGLGTVSMIALVVLLVITK